MIGKASNTKLGPAEAQEWVTSVTKNNPPNLAFFFTWLSLVCGEGGGWEGLGFLIKDAKLMKKKYFTPLWETNIRVAGQAHSGFWPTVYREATLSLHSVLQCTPLSFQLLRCSAQRTVLVQKTSDIPLLYKVPNITVCSSKYSFICERPILLTKLAKNFFFKCD